MYVHMYAGPQRSEEGIRSPDNGVTRGCEMPNVGAENRAPVL